MVSTLGFVGATRFGRGIGGREPITLDRLLDEVSMLIEDNSGGDPLSAVEAVLVEHATRATVERLVDRGLLPDDAVTVGGGLVLPDS